MKPTDRSRSGSGVVCCLKDVGPGRVQLVLDDVANSKQSTDGAWNHHTHFTYKEYDLKDIEELKLKDEELAAFGFNVLARLIALRKHPIKG